MLHELKMTHRIRSASDPHGGVEIPYLPNGILSQNIYPLTLFHKAPMSYFHMLFSVFVSQTLFWELPALILTHSLLFSMAHHDILRGPSRAQSSRFFLDRAASSPQSPPRGPVIANMCTCFQHSDVHMCASSAGANTHREVGVHIGLVR